MSTAGMSNLLDAFFQSRLEAQNQSFRLYDELLNGFESVRASAIRTRCTAIQALISGFASVQQGQYLLHRLNAPRFELFELLGVETDEIIHSRILAWALNPYGSHAQGPDLFRAVCGELGLVPEIDCSDYRVRTEHRELEARIDVVVYGRRFLIYFENKIGAGEGPEQTLRESRDMATLAARLSVPLESCLGLYLSPNRAHVAPPFRSVTWEEFAQALQKAVESIAPVEVRSFLSQWLRTLKKTGRNQ